MNYRILESKRNYDGKISWRVQYKILWFWIYVNHYSHPYEWETYDRAKAYVEEEMKRYSSHTDIIKETI